MLKKALYYRISRIWIPYIFLYFAFISYSLYNLSQATSIYTSMKNISIPTNPFYYIPYHSLITFVFIMLIIVCYVFYMSKDYIQGKTRWILIPSSHKYNVIADFVVFTISLIILHIISYVLLSFKFHQHLQILSNNQVNLLDVYYNIQYLISNDLLSSILFPHTFISIIVLLCMYLFLITGSISFLFMIVNTSTTSILDVVIYCSGIFLSFMSFNYWHSSVVQIVILLSYSASFIYLLKKNWRLKVC